jgi:hypothetical protein
MANVLSNGERAQAQMVGEANAPGQNIEDRLPKAKQLRENNTITQEGYEQMRNDILLGI